MYIDYLGAGVYEVARDNGEKIRFEEYEADELYEFFKDEPYFGERLKTKTTLAPVDIILERLKTEIYQESGTKITTDKELAEYMDVKPSHLCRCKKKGTIPYEHIALVCLDLRINMSEVVGK